MNTGLTQTNATSTQPELILELCKCLAKNDPVLSSNLTKLAFGFFSSLTATQVGTLCDEQSAVQRIKHSAQLECKDCSFEKLDLILSTICKSSVLREKGAVLSFLQRLGNSVDYSRSKWTLIEEVEKLPVLSVPSVTFRKSHNTRFNEATTPVVVTSDSSHDSIKKLYPPSEQHLCTFGGTSVGCGGGGASGAPSKQSICALSSVSSLSNHYYRSSLSQTCDSQSAGGIFVSDRDLLQDCIYALQGIESRVCIKEPGDVGFMVDAKCAKSLTEIQLGLVERLLSVGFLHNQLKRYCDSNDRQNGVICQALVAVLRDEFADYYKTVALLQTALDQSNISLRTALVSMYDFRRRFEWLAYIAEQCYDKKGGAVITAIHGFRQHGSKCAQEVSERVLAAVCKPLYVMLSRWLLDGEINDTCCEFFIEVKNISAMDRLWHDKYSVRHLMVPSFITAAQADKVLATGKSINFLRQICKDNGQLPGRELLQRLFSNPSVTSLFSPDECLEFNTVLNKVYRETSLRVLDLLKNKYRLLEHLQALRRYCLLGQGDFIRHLLELLAPELDKPVQDIYRHTLTAILDSAVRVTNAQFEDEDTIKRLNVSFMTHSRGDVGWDVFSLVYSVDGPVGTIFQPSMRLYQCLFGALWKAKRMELVLANMRRQQITMWKVFKRLTNLRPVMHIVHIFTTKMIHFLHQTQYYFLFEVLECSWAIMLRQVQNAECLDDIINAHSTFLKSVEAGVLVDDNSKELYTKLRAIYNIILSLKSQQEQLNDAATVELEAQQKYMREMEEATGSPVEDTVNDVASELVTNERSTNFGHFLCEINSKVLHLANMYDDLLNSYLKLLSSNTNMSLQLLSVRLMPNARYDSSS